ncbi:PREDICTED: ATP-dependent DNA helicase PIF1-like [Priapulus caudatus]|uniref:ATP-dependent DNA helicase PIF1 n=1 Tax=Priapulus caudatus TaxID=37621 RepID=A0ABM1E0U0_PRICU|nr:PREDICTED: ATP-dependent DNA helicase PIF1-like [Priapulus caudatus]
MNTDCGPGSYSGELDCSITVEMLAPSGEVRKRDVHRQATLALLRNEFKDVYLQLKVKTTEIKYRLGDVTVHKRFAKDGKACIRLGNAGRQLLLSNCPPDRLLLFLRCLSSKLEVTRHAKVVPMKERLKSEMPRTFQTISPLSMKDLNMVNSLRTMQADLALKENRLLGNGGSRGVKRKQPASLSITPNKGTLTKKPSLMRAPSELTSEQRQVLSAVLSGRSMFFTGGAGTGKSFLLRRIIGALPPEHTFACASTGIAACHIGGITLHSFAGIGTGSAALEQCFELAQRPGVIKQWRKCNHLIIDEVSMVDGDYFEKLEKVARVAKKNSQPFGGIQLILCGDFLQLPPISRGTERKRFCFQTEIWRKCIQVTMELTVVKRQTDPAFINLLRHIRVGRCTEEMVGKLQATSTNQISRNGILATRLCTHREDVDQINNHQLGKLQGTLRKFEATDSDPSLMKHMDKMCPVPQQLHLTEGTQVMLAKNVDVPCGLVNGARGVVTGFDKSRDGLPIVKFLCGVEQSVKAERWSCKAGGGFLLTRRQIPLKLAWAISIHKSQGMTLDCVEMSLSRVFESGQAYVALSRASSMQGLRVLDFEPTCVRANPQVVQFYQKLRKEKRMMANMIDSENKENIPPH